MNLDIIKMKNVTEILSYTTNAIQKKVEKENPIEAYRGQTPYDDFIEGKTEEALYDFIDWALDLYYS